MSGASANSWGCRVIRDTFSFIALPRAALVRALWSQIGMKSTRFGGPVQAHKWLHDAQSWVFVGINRGRVLELGTTAIDGCRPCRISADAT